MRAVALAALVGVLAPSLATASDSGLTQPLKIEVTPRAFAHASLVQLCSPSDERKGLCKRRFVIRDSYLGGTISAENHRADGSTRLQQGQLEQALQHFDEAIRLKPDYAEAFNSRGCAYLAMHRYDLALADFDTAIQLAPDFALAYFNRAETHKAVRNYERAVRDYDVYINLDPSDIDGYIHRAFAHRQLGDYPEAIADLDEAVRLKPKDSRVLNLRCWVRAVAGVELEAALKDCGESLRLQPQSCETLDSRAFVYFRLGRLNRAIVDSTAAIRINPKLASSFYIRGLAKARKKDRSAAADIATALALDPQVVREYQGYGISR